MTSIGLGIAAAAVRRGHGILARRRLLLLSGRWLASRHSGNCPLSAAG
jgi:hypothetical protein